MCLLKPHRYNFQPGPMVDPLAKDYINYKKVRLFLAYEGLSPKGRFLPKAEADDHVWDIKRFLPDSKHNLFLGKKYLLHLSQVPKEKKE